MTEPSSILHHPSSEIALITGASRGIGAALAKKMAADGAHVLLVARTVGGLEEVDDAIQADPRARKNGGRATLIPMDLLNLDTIDLLAGNIAERFGRLDTLVLNAGLHGGLMPVASIDNKIWNKVMTTNLDAPFRLLRACHPLLMQSKRASVIGLTASQARAPEPYWGLTAISKAAFEAMLNTYAQETAHTGITVHLPDPGEVNTKWLQTAWPGRNLEQDAKSPEKAAEEVLARV